MVWSILSNKKRSQSWEDVAVRRAWYTMWHNLRHQINCSCYFVVQIVEIALFLSKFEMPYLDYCELLHSQWWDVTRLRHLTRTHHNSSFSTPKTLKVKLMIHEVKFKVFIFQGEFLSDQGLKVPMHSEDNFVIDISFVYTPAPLVKMLLIRIFVRQDWDRAGIINIDWNSERARVFWHPRPDSYSAQLFTISLGVSPTIKRGILTFMALSSNESYSLVANNFFLGNIRFK